MSTEQLERPLYYEGQYLGAKDLTAAIEYARLRDARHSLGSHTWGIVVGLWLREEPSIFGGDAVDVYVDPGFAVDGFGRPIVVGERVELSPADFVDQSSGRVDVWLYYEEGETGGVGFGFARCEGDGENTRIMESFGFTEGRKSRLEKRDELVLGEEVTDAIRAYYRFDNRRPLLCDGSVPFQVFPDSDDGLWLIPLGHVRWDAAASRFIKLNEEDKLAARAKRRYAGSVAEDVLAADGLIRIRRRGVEPPADPQDIYTVCDAPTFDTSNASDLAFDEDRDWVDPQELLWIEGNVRFKGDARMFGHKIEFRDETGDIDEVPLWIDRKEANSKGGKDLRILLGKRDADDPGLNHLVIGQLTVDGDGNPVATDKLFVQDDGRVGIGTVNPHSKLGLPLTIRGDGDLLKTVGFEDAGGQVTWHVGLLADAQSGVNFVETQADESRLFLEEGGRVGIGAVDPGAKLDIQNVPATTNGSALGNDIWIRAGDGDDLGRFWVEYGNQSAPLLVLSDKDNPPRFWLQQIGDGAENNPDHSSWIGHAREESSDMALMGGNVGIGTTNPAERLHVGGPIRGNQSGAVRIQTPTGWTDVGSKNAEWSHFYTDRDKYYFNKEIRIDSGQVGSYNEDLSLRTSGNTRITVSNATGHVGVGTGGPVARLHVVDSINADAGSLAAHVAVIQNTSTGDNADVLALKVGRNNPGTANNFITFFDQNSAVGSIEGTGGGVTLKSGGADFAECLPRRDTEEPMSAGDVVGIVDGRVTRVTKGASQVMVVSDRAAVVGNVPARDNERDFEQVAFLGQIPAKVRGPIQAGQYVVASGLNDGVAVAATLDDLVNRDAADVVGRAWESSDDPDLKNVNTVVGFDGPLNSMLGLIRAQRRDIERLSQKIAGLSSSTNTNPHPSTG